MTAPTVIVPDRKTKKMPVRHGVYFGGVLWGYFLHDRGRYRLANLMKRWLRDADEEYEVVYGDRTTTRRAKRWFEAKGKDELASVAGRAISLGVLLSPEGQAAAAEAARIAQAEEERISDRNERIHHLGKPLFDACAPIREFIEAVDTPPDPGPLDEDGAASVAFSVDGRMKTVRLTWATLRDIARLIREADIGPAITEGEDE